jgi:hypothetical protein
MATVFLVHDPEDDAGTTKRARTAARHRGWLTVRAWPGSAYGSRDISDAVMSALDKDLTSRGARLSGAERWRLACIWLVAEGITDLVVLEAEFLDGKQWRRLSTLPDIQEHTAPAVWLIVHQLGLRRVHRDVVRDVDLEERTAQDLTAAAEVAPIRRNPRPAQTRRFPAVPPDDVPHFIPACRALLERSDYELVARTYTTAAAKANAWIGQPRRPSDGEVHAFLHDLIGHVTSAHEALTRLRGAQVGVLHERVLLKVWPETIAAGFRNDPPVKLDATTADLLRAYVIPQLAALTALAVAGPLPPHALHRLNRDDIHSHRGGYLVTHDELTAWVPSYAAPLILAYMLASENHGASGPLFTYAKTDRRLPAPAIQARLRTASYDTGLHLAPSWTQPRERAAHSWRFRRGFTLQYLDESSNF